MCARMSAAAAPSVGTSAVVSTSTRNLQLANIVTIPPVPVCRAFRDLEMWQSANVSARMSRSKTATIHSGIPVPKTYRMCRKWVPHSVLVEFILLWQKWGYVLPPHWRRSSALGVHCRYLSAIIINNIFIIILDIIRYGTYLLKLLLNYLYIYAGVQNIKLPPCITHSLGTSE